MLQRIALLSAFLFATFICEAQTYVQGLLRIGDTSQLHSVSTTRGDLFQGVIQYWGGDSLAMMTDGGNIIILTPHEVERISVNSLGQGAVPPSSSTLFILTTKRGKTYQGFPVSITTSRILFKRVNASKLAFNTNDVESIKPYALGDFPKEPFVNLYNVKIGNSNKQKATELLYMEDGELMLANEKGQPEKVPVKKVSSVKLKQDYRPYLGYGRSLMFMPTGFGMQKGAKEYRNIMLGINIFSKGVTDNFSFAAGAVSILPYFDAKFSFPLGKYVHWSAGGYVFIPMTAGLHTSLSIGTPDYFMNVGYFRNFEIESVGTDSDFECLGVGGSFRVSGRTRLFAEYNIFSSTDANTFGYDSFYEYGFGNSLSWGIGIFGHKYRFDAGAMAIGPFSTFTCTSFACEERNSHFPIPFVAFSVHF